MYFQRSNGILAKSPKDNFGVSFLDLLFACISKLESIGVSGHDDVEFIVLLKLTIFLVENCYQEIFPSKKLFDSIFQILIRYLSIDNRGAIVKINALQLMCILLFLSPEKFIEKSKQFNAKDQVFFTLFGQLDLFEQFKQKDDLLLGIIGLFSLHESLFPDVIPMSSLMREAFNCVGSICRNRSSLNTNIEGFSEDTKPSKETQDEEDLGSEEDEDDDDWNEEVYFQEELNYEYESPFEILDPIREFENILKVIESQNPMYFKRIISELAPAERHQLNNLFAVSKQSQNQIKN